MLRFRNTAKDKLRLFEHRESVPVFIGPVSSLIAAMICANSQELRSTGEDGGHRQERLRF